MMYFLFAGEHYYPNGGISDYVDTFDSLEVAKESLDPVKYSWGEIGILEDGKLKEIWYYRSNNPWSRGNPGEWYESGRE